MPFLTNENESTLENLGGRSNYGPNSGGQGSYTPPNPNSDPRAGGDTPSRLSADENRLETAAIANQRNQNQTPPLSPNTPTPPKPTPTLYPPPPPRPMDVFGAFEQTNIPKPSGVVGSNYFLDINAQGFILNKVRMSPTDYNLDDNGSPLIPQSKYLDSKGDFSPRFTSRAKAGDTFNTSPSPIQRKPVPADLFLDRKGDFTPVFNINNQFSSDGDVLYNLHKNGITPTSRYRNTDEGYTNYMQAVPLQTYYDRLVNDNSRLGIRRDNVSRDIFGNNNQPVIVRPIGKRWGVDTFEIPAGINAPDFVQKSIDTVAELGESIIGRNPATYMDRYSSDVIRLLPYGNPISTYAVKQIVFQKRNPFDRISSLKYSSLNDSSIKTRNAFEGLTTLSKRVDSLMNPQVYNPLSIFSTPGVVMLNRHGFRKDISEIPKDVLELGALVSTSAIVHMAPVAANITKDVIKLGMGTASLIGAGLAGLSNPFSGLSNPFSDLQNPFAGMSNPFASAKNPFANVKNPFAGVKNPFAGMNNPFAGLQNPFSKLSNPFAKASINGISLRFPKKLSEGFQAVGEALEPVVDHLQAGAEAAREVAKDFAFFAGPIGKARLKKFSDKAEGGIFDNIGVDQVNMIPVGATEHLNKKTDDWDFCPFRFTDIRSETPITFRAILSGITDNFQPEYSSERYVGRPDSVHVYQGTNREISFTFSVYPKSDAELGIIWQKLNRLAGLTYPHMSEPTYGGRAMISPYTRLTIGDMYKETPGYISSLTYNVMDEGTWEIGFAKLPKYIQANVTFTYIGDHHLHSTQKLFGVDSIPVDIYQTKLKSPMGEFASLLTTGDTTRGSVSSFAKAFNDPNVSQEKTGKRFQKSLGQIVGDLT